VQPRKGTENIAMNTGLSKAIALGLFAALGATAGCLHGAPSQNPSEETGTVGVQLTLPGGEVLDTLSWQVLSGTTVVQSGQVNVADSQTLSFLVSGLESGAYTITLTGTSTDGTVTCAGSGTFTVIARGTARASINLQCATGPVDAGSVSVTATLNSCATWQSLSASPSEVNVGGTVTLNATATAPAAAALTYQWSAPSGTFGSPTAATTTFTSTTPGPVTVTLLVGDGPVAAGFTCSASLDTTSTVVTFDTATDAGSGESASGTAAGSIFVIDSTDKLWSFDTGGNSLATVALPTPIGNINGGGIALSSNDLYVTIGQFTNAVTSFDLTLSPHALPAGAFPGLSVPRGIAYDTNNQWFYVGNGAATVNVYGSTGSSIATGGGFPGAFGPSGVAYDSDDNAIWVANYVGAPAATPPVYGVSEYTPNGAAAQTFDRSTQFVAPGAHQEPYSIAVCPTSATGDSTVVVVGFIDDGSGEGTGTVQSYSTSGAPIGSPFAGPISKPYALSCDSQGNVYIADVTGLYRENTAGQNIGLPGSFAGLTPPIYGVLAVPGSVGGGGAVDDGGSEGAVRADTGAPDAPARADAEPPDAPTGVDEGGFDGPRVAFDYSVPLNTTGPIGSSVGISPAGTQDPNTNQSLTFSVVNGTVTPDLAFPGSPSGVWTATTFPVNAEPIPWLTPVSNGLTTLSTPYSSTWPWPPAFGALQGYIQINFAVPVSTVSVQVQDIISSNDDFGSPGTPPLPFIDAWSQLNGDLAGNTPIGPVVGADNTVSVPSAATTAWSTLTITNPGQIWTVVIGAQSGPSTDSNPEIANVIFQNLSYQY
jgi:hypothetical protein